MSNNEPDYEYRLKPEYEYGPDSLAPSQGPSSSHPLC